MWLFGLIISLGIFAYVTWAIRRGKIRSRTFVHSKKKEPTMFWLMVGIYLFLAIAMLLPVADNLHSKFPSYVPKILKHSD